MLGFGVVSELAEPDDLGAAIDRQVASALALPSEPRNGIKRLMLELEGGSFERQLGAVRPHALATMNSAQARQQIATLLAARKNRS